MALTVKNEAEATTYADQAELHRFDLDQVVSGIGGTGVLTGGVVAAQGSPNTTVAVTAGAGLGGSQIVAWAAGNVTMAAADATNPRFDLVYASSAGVLTWLAGTAGTNPTPPDLPANGIALAVVYVPATQATVTSAMIADKRVLVRLPNPTATYTIHKAAIAPIATYLATKADGTVALLSPDTATTSGLKPLVESLTVDAVHLHFTAGRFQLLDAPLGSESWANTETKLSFSDLRGVRISGEGMLVTTIGSYTNTSTASPDAATFLFTRCVGWTVTDLTLEQCGAYLSTMETFNANQGRDFRLERIRVLASRSDGIIFDGGDIGMWAGRNVVRDCIVQGRPLRPTTLLQTGGSLAASTAYQYAVSWVDANLGGVGVSGETRPSEPNAVTTDTTQKKVRVSLTLGPSTVTARKVYRWDAVNGWLLIATVANNTATTVDDDGTGSTSAASFALGSTVPGVGIYLLASSGNLVQGSTVDGTGDPNTAGPLTGIQCGYKGTTPADRNRIADNLVEGSASHGIRFIGASDNIASGNTIVNPGYPSVKAAGLRIEGIAGIATNRNELVANIVKDTRDSTHPNGGVGLGNAISITSTNAPTDNGLFFNTLNGMASAAISDSGTTTRFFGNTGWSSNPALAALNFVIDGGGSAITTGVKGDVRIPFACDLAGVELQSDQSGSIVIDIWKSTYAALPATVTNTITASAKPTISSATKSQDLTLTGWTTAVAEGDWLRFNVDSATTVTRVTISLYLKRR